MPLADASEIAQVWLYNFYMIIKVLIGFSIIIFFHELGHFLAAKWVGVRVDRFAVGFGSRVVGYRRGEGLTFGSRPEYTAEELARKGYGETDYCLRLLPIGGYVKMLGQDDLIIDEKTGDIQLSNDPRAFTSRPVGQRMIVASAGVIFNLLFAAVLLMAIYMIGRQAEPPVIGFVPAESPARGKLLPGDHVLRVNGDRVRTFTDMLIASILSGGEVELEIERDGQRLPEPIRVETTRNEAMGGLDILLVGPAREPLLTSDVPARPGEPAPRAGDRIVAVNGQPITSVLDVETAFASSMGRPVELTVERQSADDQVETLTYTQQPQLQIRPAVFPLAGVDRFRLADSISVLGMHPRWAVEMVVPGTPAEEAGFRPGDVVLVWDGIPNPTHGEILRSIAESPAGQIAVRVQRNGQDHDLKVTPRGEFRLFSQSRPQVGLVFMPDLTPIVTKVMPDSPAAALQLPRGARITAVNETEVRTWSELIEALFAEAGRDVTLQYTLGGTTVGGPLRVPSSLYNELGFTPTTRVASVDGRKTIEIEAPGSGESADVAIGSPWALRRYLSQRVGQTVTIEYAPELDADLRQATFHVTADNIDPWQLRVDFKPRWLEYQPVLVDLQTNNPAEALWLGVHEVKSWVFQVYAFLKSLVSRSNNIGIEDVSGPVGIVSAAVERAKVGWVELLHMLALLSVNLAVINFLPIPVMDGGLMVFLLIEKIKGKPLSIKTQIISTLVGLAAIVLIGLIVTFQDIGKLLQ